MVNKKMNQIGNFPDGIVIIQNSPWHSMYFRVTSSLGAISVLLVAYLLNKHWQTLSQFSIIGLGIFVGAHLIYQWWRALRYHAKIRALCSTSSSENPDAGTPHDAALRIAVGGIDEILFYSFGMTLICLVLIGGFLTRLDGIH